MAAAVALVLIGLAATAAAQSLPDELWLDRGARARMMIAEVGKNKDSHVTTECNPAIVGSVEACYTELGRKAVGNYDYTTTAQEVKFPTDGKPWGMHMTGPYPDGASYLVSWYAFGNKVGVSSDPKDKPDTSAWKAEVRLSTAGPNGPWQKTLTGAVITYKRIYNPPSSPTDHDRTPYNYLSPYINHVVLTGLKARTTYWYQVQTVSPTHQYGWSASIKFTTLPNGQMHGKGCAKPYPLKIGLIADVGQTLNSSATRDHIMANKPDVAILVADFAYADNYGAADANNLTGIGGTNQQRWDTWHALWEPFTKITPIIHCAGNHEIENVGINANITYNTYSFSYPSNYPFQSYSARWPAPGITKNWGDITQNLYSYSTIGGVATVLNMNNYVAFHSASPQYKYFMDLLRKVDRKKTPWLIVQFHAPPYHTYYTHYKEMECFMSIWEPIFYQYGVDIVLNGHVHAYERTHPVYKYQRDDCGPMYITIGDAGNVEGPYRNFVDDKSSTNVPYCTLLSQGGFTPAQMQVNKTAAPWGPSYQTQAHPPGCPTLSFQPDYDTDGPNPGILVPSQLNPKLGFCQSSQPLWSAHRDPSFGHAILTLTSDTTADIAWYCNIDGKNPPAADVTSVKRMPAACQHKMKKMTAL